MDLLQILRSRIDSLETGEYTPGLRAVLQHVQVASNHLSRGVASGDDAAFTDAIYRTNQAFEGSLKEAYRFLAGKDPSKVRPFDIENFFQSQAVLRPRVLEQLSTYRTDWRNPSTHDYKLDFDDDEALLAIVSVYAFAIVLIDQMIEKANYDKARASPAPNTASTDQTQPLAEIVAKSLLSFRFEPLATASSKPAREIEVAGALAGHLNNVIPGVKVDTDVRLVPDQHLRADMVLGMGKERMLIELKRSRPLVANAQRGVEQLSRYVSASGIKNAALYLYDDTGDAEMERSDYPLPGSDARVVVVRPKSPIVLTKLGLQE